MHCRAEHSCGQWQALEKSLNPFLRDIAISPSLIHTIADTEPGEDWLPAISELEVRLSAIRGGPRVAARQSLDDVAEKLRVKVNSAHVRPFI
jgi:hypothetical protein